MAADPLKQCSPDLLLRLLKACDSFSDLVRLAASCKTIHSVWVAQRSGLIWELASKNILAFNSALMAVRATKIVAHARRDAIEAPHPFPVKDLSGEIEKPTLEELKSIFEFEHLIKCVEHMMRSWKVQNELDGDYGRPVLLLDESGPLCNSIKYPLWRERLHRGLYHVLLAGAACSRPYNAPFVQAQNDANMEFLDRCSQCKRRAKSPLTDEDIEYLRRFPVYAFHAPIDSDIGKWRQDEYQNLFGSLAEWLIESGAEIGTREQLKNTSIYAYDEADGIDWSNSVSFDSRQTGSIREIKTLLGAYEHFHRKISHIDFSDSVASAGKPVPNFKDQKHLEAIVFGLFQLDNIALPQSMEDSENGFLLAESTESLSLPKEIDIRAVLYHLSRRTPRGQDDYPPHPPEYELFSFVVRKHFNLKWKADITDPGYGREVFERELKRGDIFQLPADTGGFGNESLVLSHIPAE